MKIGEKYFLNLQEAVGWLLANNALPFQSTANYVADTEIAKSTIINPSPAEIKVGALVLFANSKVGTVSGLTSNGFMVGSDYTNIKDALAYITSITLDAAEHLVTTLSDGDAIDAGLIRMVSSFSINASQHLVANFNNGTSQDLGAIFSGNVNISGDLTATHAKLLETLEDANGHKRFVEGSLTSVHSSISVSYNKWSLSGTHLMIVLAGSIASGETLADNSVIGQIILPTWIGTKIQAIFAGIVEYKTIPAYASDYTSQNLPVRLQKSGDNLAIIKEGSNTLNANRSFRLQFDLLIDNS